MESYIASVGMEVHAEISSQSKMFCRCPVGFGGEPNTRVCPICLGLPGTLPVPNKAAIDAVLKTALALNCTIAMDSIFHRKNYFYPDLPKGYQVSQYGETNPLGCNGYLDISGAKGDPKRIRIRRVHLEEDTGKLMHLPSGGSGIDFNRAGVPLMEIVTEFPPDIQTPEESKDYLSELRKVLLYLGVCNGKMEEGSLRCEPNISIRKEDSKEYGTKTELKNLNSFRSVALGVAFEVRRQEATLEAGGVVNQETRGWNEAKESSFLMRIKETENDYRYFPDPDLMPMQFTEGYIATLRESLPELPLTRMNRYQMDFGLSPYDAGVLTSDQTWAKIFETIVNAGGDPKLCCNWMTGEWAKLLNESGTIASESKITSDHILEILELVQNETISGKTAKATFAEAFKTGKLPKQIIKESGATQITDENQIREAALNVINMNPEVVAKYKSGQISVAGFLVGNVMKATGGRANAEIVQRLVKEILEK